jgi:hypothetical protein
MTKANLDDNHLRSKASGQGHLLDHQKAAVAESTEIDAILLLLERLGRPGIPVTIGSVGSF